MRTAGRRPAARQRLGLAVLGLAKPAAGERLRHEHVEDVGVFGPFDAGFLAVLALGGLFGALEDVGMGEHAAGRAERRAALKRVGASAHVATGAAGALGRELADEELNDAVEVVFQVEALARGAEDAGGGSGWRKKTGKTKKGGKMDLSSLQGTSICVGRAGGRHGRGFAWIRRRVGRKIRRR